LNLDGQGLARGSAGIRFFDHMLESAARHVAICFFLLGK
jgi:imidazoleglycerol phosphate dehydratase HisB